MVEETAMDTQGHSLRLGGHSDHHHRIVPVCMCVCVCVSVCVCVCVIYFYLAHLDLFN